MNVGIIGSGFVGSAAANAIALRGSAAEMVLINLNEKCSGSGRGHYTMGRNL
jgi:malate/lactate dehydrogenase